MKKILILLFIITIVQLFSITNWLEFSLDYFSTDAKDNIDIVTSASQEADNINTKGKFGAKLKYEMSGSIAENITFDVYNNAFYSEKSHEQRNSFLYNEVKAKLAYYKNDTYFKIQFNNRYYNDEETNFLNLPGIEYDTQQQMINTAIFHLKQDFGRLNFNFYNSLRNLAYKYAVPEDDDDKNRDDEDELESKTANDFDLYSLSKISFNLTENLSLFSRAYIKHDFNENDELNETDIGAGIEYDGKIDFPNAMLIRISYYNLHSDAIDDVFTHNILTEYRYTKRFFIPLVGFISYKNRSVYDQEQDKLLRVSNLLRLHLKYNYLTEKMKDSYILAGFRLNPENDGNLFLGEFNQYVFTGLYATIGAKFSPELYTQFNGRVEYFFTPLKLIWLKTEYTDFENRFGQNILSLGTTLIF